FCFTDTASPAIYTLSLHDALPICESEEIHLLGTSMGAAAILKASRDYQIEPTSIILECPFGSLYETVSARFRIMNAPPFPLAAVDRKSTRLNSSHVKISYAVFCLK